MLTTAVLYSKYCDSLSTLKLLFTKQKRGDLCICTYYFWQMTGRMAKRGHDRNKGALEVASNVGEGGNVRLAFDPPLS